MNGTAEMHGTAEAINSIEWAVLFAALVLTARLYSIIQAIVGVQAVQGEVLKGLATLDSNALERRTRSLLYRNPYAELAAALVHAAQADLDREQRTFELGRTLQIAARRLKRRTNQGKLADLLALFIALIVVIYSRSLLLEGPLFWSCAGAMFVTLIATLATRALLLSQLLSNADALRTALIAQPPRPLPSPTSDLPEGAPPCHWCSSTTRRVNCQLLDDPTHATPLDATLCTVCGKLVATVEPV